MSSKYRLAILTSCYNRRDRSLKCINSLINAGNSVPDVDISFYVWDDGSTDGTSEALLAVSDSVRLYKGPGDYYWSKSMHEVMKKAVENDHDLYLMVNDDVTFYDGSLQTMIENYEEGIAVFDEPEVVKTELFDVVVYCDGLSIIFENNTVARWIKTGSVFFGLNEDSILAEIKVVDITPVVRDHIISELNQD